MSYNISYTYIFEHSSIDCCMMSDFFPNDFFFSSLFGCEIFERSGTTWQDMFQLLVTSDYRSRLILNIMNVIKKTLLTFVVGIIFQNY